MDRWEDVVNRILIVIGLAAVLVLMFILSGHADTLGFPFPAYLKELQQELKAEGIVIDKDGFDRTDKSMGYFTDGMSGSSFVIETYYSVKPEDLQKMHEVVMGHYSNNKDRLWRKPQ